MDNKVEKFYQASYFRLFIILTVIFSLLFVISGVSNPNKDFPLNEDIAISKTICPMAGIGDNLSDFERTYGKMIENNGMKSFKSNKINIFVLNGIVYKLAVRVNSPAKLSIDSIKDFLPSDMKILKEYNDIQYNNGKKRYIIIGKSEMLKIIFPEEKGKFAITQQININRGGGYNSFIITLGDTP